MQKIAAGYDPSVVAKTMPDALAAHPDANVFVADADTSALAAVPAVEAAGLTEKMKLIGTGGSRLGAKAVADGTLFGTVGAWPVQGAEIAGKMAIAAVNGQPIAKPGVDALTIDEPGQVTPETVGEFTPEWGKQKD